MGHVRAFNRTVTQQVGALDDHYLARGRALGEARMLWEIGIDGSEVRALRRRLELDSAQVSRLLRALERDGLVKVRPGHLDKRIRVATLTPRGLREREILDRRSDDLALQTLAPLDPSQQERLVDAMQTVARLLTASRVELRELDANHPDSRQCLRAYFAELDRRSESGFDPDAGLPADPHEMRPPAGAFLVAYLRQEPVGCGGVKHHPGEASEIKRMWVSPSARGLGLGRRLLAELEARAVAAGAPAVRLETNAALTEAIQMYRTSGYSEVAPFNAEPFADHWFEKNLDRRR